MFKKILIISLAIIALTSIKANAQYLCGSTGYIYRNQGFCNANCSLNGSPSPCGELTSSATSAPACPSGYEGFVFDPNNNTTYALNTANQFWTYFQNQDSSSQSLMIITGSDINGIGQSMLGYYNIPSAWIGLYDPQMSADYNTVNPDRPYSWVSGSTPSYYNWASEEPNNTLPDQDLSLLPQTEYGQHWIEMESNGTWNDIGYNYTYPSSQNYAPYLPALVQFNNQLSCVSGAQSPTALTSGQQTNLVNQYCGGNTSNCYLCSNGTSMAECQSGNTFPSGSAELCPYSQTQCNKNTSAPQCPSGSTYNSSVNECAAPPVCPSGYTFINNECSETLTSQSTCPSGSTYNSSVNECVTKTSPTCPSGTSYDGSNGQCVTTTTVSPTCPSGTSYSNGECAAPPECSTNYTYDSSTGECTVTNATEDSCPSGYTLSNGTCLSTATTTPTCPSGSFSNGQCLSTPSCPSGYTLSNGTCAKQVTSTTSPTCPSGYAWNGSTCAEQVISTTTTTSNPQIQSNTFNNNNGIYGLTINGNSIGWYSGQYDGCGGAQWYDYAPTGFSGFSMSGSIGWFCTDPVTLIGEGNTIQGVQINRSCTSYTRQCTYHNSGRGYTTCTNVCNSWSYSESSVGSISVSGASATGTTTLNVTVTTSGNQINGNWNYILSAPADNSCPTGFYYSNGNCYQNGGVLTFSGISVSSTVTTTQTASPTCPSGYTWNGSTCAGTTTQTTSLTCPSGSTLSNGECASSATCPSGYTYNNSTQLCDSNSTATPICPSGYTLSNNECVSTATATPTCPSGTTFSASDNECLISATCPSGYTLTNNECVNNTYSTPNVCPSGYTLSNGQCVSTANSTPSCPSGYTFQSNGVCSETVTQTPTCNLSGFTFINGACISAGAVSCPSETTLQGNECVSYTCPLGNNNTCVNTGSGYYCSSYPCSSYNNSSAYNVNSPNINANNPTNNGATNSAGQCLGQVYIFSGQAMQCRDPGVQTGWGGGCCTADKKWFGLANCNSQEKLLAQQRAAGDCTMVGTYCAQSFLGYCLQTDQTWCCFPSLLANIIQQQTRAIQGLPISGWGTAQSPNCIGYTPQQFQAINFSQIDLSAFYNSIVQQTSSVISNAATNAVNKFQQSLSGN